MAKDLNEINLSTDTFVQEFLNAYKEAKGTEYDTTKKAGNNGYSLGQQFVLTGAVKTAKVTQPDGTVSAVYIALETKEGVDLSLQSIMGLSSMRGYEKSGSYPNEFHLKSDKDKVLADQVAAEVVDGFDFEDTYKPVTREILKFAAFAKENEIFKGKTATFLGTVVRPYVSKKETTDISDSKKVIKPGYKRAQTAKLWSVK